MMIRKEAVEGHSQSYKFAHSFGGLCELLVVLTQHLLIDIDALQDDLIVEDNVFLGRSATA